MAQQLHAKNLVEKLDTDSLNLLTSGWLQPGDAVCPIHHDQRLDQLKQLRTTYVPILVLMRHELLYNSYHLIPTNLFKSVQVLDLVADDDYTLYQAFTPTSLPRLLSACHKAIVANATIFNNKD
jgi:hypothetical protein